MYATPSYKIEQRQVVLFDLLSVAASAYFFGHGTQVVLGFGEGALAAITTTATPAAASAAVGLWPSSSWLACCLCDTCSVATTTCTICTSNTNLHSTQLCCRRFSSAVRYKPRSHSSTACGNFVTTGGYFRQMLIRAH